MPAQPLVWSLLCPALWHVGGHGGREGPGCRAGCRGDGRGEGRACHFSRKHPGESSTGVERVCLEGGSRVGVLCRPCMSVLPASTPGNRPLAVVRRTYVRTRVVLRRLTRACSGMSSEFRPYGCAPMRPRRGAAHVHGSPDAGGSQAPDPGELGDVIRVGMPFGCAPDAVRPTCLQGNSTHALPVRT